MSFFAVLKKKLVQSLTTEKENRVYSNTCIPGKKGIKLGHIGLYWILFDPINFYAIKYNFESDQIKSNMILSVAIGCNRNFVYIKMNMIEYDSKLYLIA